MQATLQSNHTKQQVPCLWAFAPPVRCISFSMAKRSQARRSGYGKSPAMCCCNAMGRAGLVPWALSSTLQWLSPGIAGKVLRHRIYFMLCHWCTLEPLSGHLIFVPFFSLSSQSVGYSKSVPLLLCEGARFGGSVIDYNLKWNESMRNNSSRVFLCPQKKCVDSSALCELMVYA